MWRSIGVVALVTVLSTGSGQATETGVWEGKLTLTMRAQIFRSTAEDPQPTRILGTRRTFDAAIFEAQGGTFLLRLHEGDVSPLPGDFLRRGARSDDIALSADAGDWLQATLKGVSDWDPMVGGYRSIGKVRKSRSGRQLRMDLKVRDIFGNIATGPLSDHEYTGGLRLRLRATRR